MAEIIKTVAVYCGHSAGNDKIYIREAKKLGKMLATHGLDMVFGGGNVGLMGAVAGTSIENGGNVIGISTNKIINLLEPMHTGIDVKVVKNLNRRKYEMNNLADAFIVLPGGMGTLDELTEVLTMQQIGETQKTIILLNTNNFWNPFIKLLKHMQNVGFINKNDNYNLAIADTPSDIIKYISQFNNFVSTGCATND